MNIFANYARNISLNEKYIIELIELDLILLYSVYNIWSSELTTETTVFLKASKCFLYLVFITFYILFYYYIIYIYNI